MKPKSAKEARLAGVKTYFTGVPCKRGGIAERRLNGDCLCELCTDFYRKLKAEWSRQHAHKNKAWREANPDKMALYKKKWSEKNKEKAKANTKKWKVKNPHKVLADTEKRRASKNNAVPGWYSDFDDFAIQEAVKLSKDRELATGIKWSVDHMIPLRAKSACGLHIANNIQVIPSSLNFSKMNRMQLTEPLEWIKHL